MKQWIALTVALAAATAWGNRESANFNEGWRFAHFGAMPDGSEKAEPSGMEKTAFDDSGWRVLNVPHDWGIEGPFRGELPNRTGKLPWAGIGWYRKTVAAPASDAGKKIFIDFDGAMSHPQVFGEFVWTGFDYIGEPTPYNKDATNLLNFSDPEERKRMEKELERLGTSIPPRSSYFGIVDLCGFKKDRFYIYQARWRPELPMAHILPHWNWPERIGEVTPVHVYTSGDEAELFLNGKSLGRKKKGDFEYRLRWDDVAYQPGELKVVAYKNGKPWAGDVQKTTGVAAKLELGADRSEIAADGSDLSFITVRVLDHEGLEVPRSHNRVQFRIEGPGEIIAVGNGDPTSHEPFQTLERKVFNGMALVVVRSEKGRTGRIKLSASSEGLQGAQCEVKTVAVGE